MRPKPGDAREAIAKRMARERPYDKYLAHQAAAYEAKLPDQERRELYELSEVARNLQVGNKDTIKEYHAAARSAFNAGHANHPHVVAWMHARWFLDQPDQLRALKNNQSGLTRKATEKRRDATKLHSIEAIWLRAVLEDAGLLGGGDARALAPRRIDDCVRRRLRSTNWLPEWMERTSDGQGGFLSTLVLDKKAFKASLTKRLKTTPQAFSQWLLKLELYSPRFRRKTK